MGTKTPDEVRKYLQVFFERMQDLNDFASLKRKLERANVTHSFRKQAPVLISRKVQSYERPIEEMTINVVQKSKYFSKEADVLLLCLTHEHGYGNWQKIKHALRRGTLSRFDHILMSRSVQEISRRVDILVKSIEKEIQDAEQGVLPGAGPSKPSKAKGSKAAKELQNNSDLDDDMLDEGHRDEDVEMKEDKLDLGDEAKVRAGADDRADDIDDEQPVLAGKKRPRKEYSDEEEDLDFDAIKQQTDTAKL